MDYGKAGNPLSMGKQPKHKVGKKGLGAENSATGCADDLLDAARIASDETVRIMKEKAK